MIIKVGKNILPKRDPAVLSKSVATLCDSLVLVSSLELPWWITNAEEEVSVEINDVIYFRGRIDTISETTKDKKVRIFCRDLTADLVDCPHIGTGEFRKITPLEIMKKIATPFGINVNDSLSSSVIQSFGHSLDEKCASILQRLGQSVGWIITSDGQDGLSHWSTEDIEVQGRVVKGRNADFVLSYNYKNDFSYFKTLGQGNLSKGELQGLRQLTGSANRYRPYIHLSSSATDGTRLALEADRIKDYVEGGKVSAEVFYYGDLNLLPGQKISLVSGDVENDMFIKSVTIKKTKDFVTVLDVVLPGRFGAS